MQITPYMFGQVRVNKGYYFWPQFGIIKLTVTT